MITPITHVSGDLEGLQVISPFITIVGANLVESNRSFKKIVGETRLYTCRKSVPILHPLMRASSPPLAWPESWEGESSTSHQTSQTYDSTVFNVINIINGGHLFHHFGSRYTVSVASAEKQAKMCKIWSRVQSQQNACFMMWLACLYG